MVPAVFPALVVVPAVFPALVAVVVVGAGLLAMVEAVPVVRPLEVVVAAVAVLPVPAVVTLPVPAVVAIPVLAMTHRAVSNNVVRCLQQVTLCTSYPPIRRLERMRPSVPAHRKLRREIGLGHRHRQRLPWVTREFVAAVV